MTVANAQTGAIEAPKTKVRRIQAEDFQFYVRQIYRLFRVSTMHLLNNDAVTKLVEQTVTHFSQLREAELERLNILFVDKTVFVNGQLLKADPDVYQLAIKLAQFIQRLGFNELSIAHDVSEEDLRALMNVFVGSWTPSGPEERNEVKFKRVKLRRVKSEVLDLLRVQAVSPKERLARTYASALVVMRHAWQRLLESQPPSLKSIKRVVQQMVRESSNNPIAFQVLARMRNVHDDPAGQAVKQALVSIAMLRPLTSDVKVLARVAMASLHFDLGRPRALGARAGSQVLASGPLPAPTSEQREAFPEETVLAGLIAAQIHPEALERVVVAFEAQHIAIDADRVPMPSTASLVDLEPFFVIVARRYAEAMAFDVSTQRHMLPHEAITWMIWNCRNRVELLVTRLLTTALRIEVPDDLFAASAARDHGIQLENKEYTLPGRPMLERHAEEPAQRPARHISGSHATAQKPRADRYDPLQDEELIRRAHTASHDAVRGPSESHETGATVLRSALTANEVQDDLLTPFFRERTGSFRALTGKHPGVPSASPAHPAMSTGSHPMIADARRQVAAPSAPEPATAPQVAPHPVTATQAASHPVAATQVASNPVAARSTVPSRATEPGPPAFTPERTAESNSGVRQSRLAALADAPRPELPLRLDDGDGNGNGEQTSRDRMAASSGLAPVPRAAGTHASGSRISTQDTQIRMAALAVAVEASQQRAPGGDPQATVVADSLRVATIPPRPELRAVPSGNHATAVAPAARQNVAAADDATVYVPMNKANAPGSLYMQAMQPQQPASQTDVQDSPTTAQREPSSDDKKPGSLESLLSDYLKKG